MSFKVASKFKEAAKVINCITLDKFPMVLTRIISKLHLRNSSLFKEEEEAQLRTLFGLNDENLQLVLNCIAYIFEQAAFTSTGVEPLKTILLEAGFESEHATIVGNVWQEQAPDLVAKLKQRILGAPTLIDTDYHLNLTLGVDELSRLQNPTAIFEFSVSNPAKPPTTMSTNSGIEVEGGVDKVAVEMNHEDLYDFFLKLEKVQNQLDKLS